MAPDSLADWRDPRPAVRSPVDGSARHCWRTGFRTRAASDRPPTGLVPVQSGAPRSLRPARVVRAPQLALRAGPGLQCAQPLLIITDAIRARSLLRRRRGRISSRRTRSTDHEHDREHPERNPGHDPGLHASRQDTLRDRTTVGDGGCACRDSGLARWDRWRVGHSSPSLLRKREAFFPERQIALVQNLGHDVRALLHVEIHEGRLAVLHFIQRRELARVRLDIGELAVVPDRAHEKWLFVLGCPIRELQPTWVLPSDMRQSFRLRGASRLQ